MAFYDCDMHVTKYPYSAIPTFHLLASTCSPIPNHYGLTIERPFQVHVVDITLQCENK